MTHRARYDAITQIKPATEFHRFPGTETMGSRDLKMYFPQELQARHAGLRLLESFASLLMLQTAADVMVKPTAWAGR